MNDKVRILNLEDDARDSELIRLRLEAAGVACELLRVETEADYLRALQQAGFDLIVADVSLPSFDGARGLELARQHRPEVPFIFFSGTLGEERAVASLQNGAADYVVKQRPARLAAAVQRALEQAEARRESSRVDAALHAAYSELDAIHANAPVALLVVDEELRIEKANEMAGRLSGRSASELRGSRCGEVFRCGTADPDNCGCGTADPCPGCPVRLAVAAIFRDGTLRGNFELSVRTPGDVPPKYRWLLVSGSAIEYGRRKCALLCAQDVTEVKQAHLDLRQQRDALALQAQLISLSHDAIILADQNRVIAGWSVGAQETYGWTEAEVLGKIMDHLFRTSATISTGSIDEILNQDGRWGGELEHSRRDGTRLTVESRQVLLRDPEGNPTGILEINRDITERLRDEEALKVAAQAQLASLEEKTVLLKEIHHRVKNNLAIIASLLNMKAGMVKSEDARAALQESQERVRSMALIHEHLYRSGDLNRIDFAEYAGTLLDELSQALIGEPGRIIIKLALEPIRLGIDLAIPCGLILNELMTNAFKYAFPDGRNGEVLVSFRESSRGTLELAIQDDGIGMPVGLLDNPQTKSLGLRIVGILTNQLDGSVEQKPPPGTRIAIRFPAGIERGIDPSPAPGLSQGTGSIKDLSPERTSRQPRALEQKVLPDTHSAAVPDS